MSSSKAKWFSLITTTDQVSHGPRVRGPGQELPQEYGLPASALAYMYVDWHNCRVSRGKIDIQKQYMHHDYPTEMVPYIHMKSKPRYAFKLYTLANDLAMYGMAGE